MKPSAERLSHWLHEHRTLRVADSEPRNLLPSLKLLQRWQSRRLALSFADLAKHPRFAAATRFFLDDLYGEHDFSARDHAIERVAPLLVRLLSEPVIATVADAVEVGALSHRLDLAMAEALHPELEGGGVLDTEAYARAYRAVGDRTGRERQIELIVILGHALEGHVRRPWVRRLLRLARGPARGAGLGELQGFLERGFAAFLDMGEAAPFLDTIESRERSAMDGLYSGMDDPFALGDEAPRLALDRPQPKASSR
ncbi:MAG TPA: hypothetical protein PKZ76_10695 [Xanthomonadaceae bacterium]|nr:hypothetical protein [Xanthomonadaceae bacterium]